MGPKRTTASRGVSPNNPCPFLRSLVAEGLLRDDQESLGRLASTIVRVARAGDGRPKLPYAAVYAIALMANGLGPGKLARNQLRGIRLDELRGGPLDKKGAGSGILDGSGRIDRAQLDRLEAFASEKTDAGGPAELGLDLAQLHRMMDANFERAKGRRRRIDRRLMDGEWPVLLQVMGKEGRGGRYLSLVEVRDLFVERRLPARMLERLEAGT